MDKSRKAIRHRVNKSRIFDALREPSFASALEREYAVSFAEECESGNAAFWLLMNASYWLVALPFSLLTGMDAPVSWAFATFSVPMILLSVLTSKFTVKIKTLRRMQLIGFAACNLVMLIITRIDMLDGVGQSALAVFWYIGATGGMVVLAFRSRVHAASLVLLAALFSYGFHDYPEPILAISIAITLTWAGSTVQIVLHRFFKVDAIKSFRLQATFTPEQVILSAMKRELSPLAMFAPAKRFCVCICSDWRSFQSWAGQTSSADLAHVLTEYYNHQNSLLKESFPRGNYFMDWIADEMFVVAFIDDESQQAEVIRESVTFAKACIEARTSFFQTFGAPTGLDVGVSCGMATVGILGPLGNMKATALGSVPGVARRLQSFAKEIRKIRGECDRLFVDPMIKDILPPNDLGLFELAISSKNFVKDLDVPLILVYESSAIRNEVKLRVA